MIRSFIILLLIAAPALAEVRTVCDTTYDWHFATKFPEYKDWGMGEYDMRDMDADTGRHYRWTAGLIGYSILCHEETTAVDKITLYHTDPIHPATGDEITPVSPFVSGLRLFDFNSADDRVALSYEPLGIPRWAPGSRDQDQSEQIFDWTLREMRKMDRNRTIKLPSIDDWVDCWIEKYRGKVCVFNDSGVGWWYEDQDGWHSVWLDIGPINDHPLWPQPQVQGPRSIYDICKFNDTLGWWLDFDSVTNRVLAHLEPLPAHDQDDRNRMFLKIDTVCDCPKGYAKEYWTTQTWHYWKMDTGESGVRVDTAKFPFFRCMKWVDFLGTGEKDHGIEADPICHPETTVCVWDKDAGVGRMSYKVVVK